MALINCPECGKQISDKAERCIGCGFPVGQGSPTNSKREINDFKQNNQKNPSSHRTYIFPVVVICIFLLFISWLVYTNFNGRRQQVTISEQQNQEVKQPNFEKIVDDAFDKAKEEVKNEQRIESRQVENTRPQITIKAPQLYAEYEENEVKADREYKGKIIQVVGLIDGFGTGLMEDDIYITLITEDAIGTVQCNFKEEYKTQIAMMTKGQYVTIVGRCTGKFFNVCLEHCRFN